MNKNTFVVDASALLAAWLPGESYRDEANGLLHDYMRHGIELSAPSYLPAELLNGLYMAVRGKGGQSPRIALEQALRAWAAFEKLRIPLHDTTTLAPRALELAREYNRPSTYDMVYIALAEQLQTTFLTADQRLVQAVSDKLSWVLPLAKYTSPGI